MAKYTQLYIDYLLNGGQNPTVFTNIENFENRFIERYCDSEIGFETPELFKLKLEAKANVVIPFYVEKLNIYKNLLEKYKEYKGREITETTSNSRDKVYNYGETVEQSNGTGTNGVIQNKTWELPLLNANLEENAPQNVTKQDEFTNTTIGTTTRNAYENKDSDDFSQSFNHNENLSNSEIQQQIQFILSQKNNIINECLNEFNSLFMQIW